MILIETFRANSGIRRVETANARRALLFCDLACDLAMIGPSLGCDSGTRLRSQSQQNHSPELGITARS